MFKWLTRGADKPGTRLGPVVERIEDLERQQQRFKDALAELEDTLAKRFDKYRKRLEREEPEAPSPEPEAHGARRTGGLPPLPRVPGKNGRGDLRDVIDIRRGRGRFPGGG